MSLQLAKNPLQAVPPAVPGMGAGTKQQVAPGSGQPQEQGGHADASALFAAHAVTLADDRAAGELVTPANAEAPMPLLPAAQAPLPPLAQCLFCGGLGSVGACGPLRPATVDGERVMVHHLCAIWAPGCYLPEGSSTYVNLEAEARRARTRACSACGLRGAAVPCSHPWCRTAFHLPCALGAPGVQLDSETFEAWCPSHADGAEAASDDDYTAAPTPARPRRQTGGGGSASSKRPRPSTESQRPRTDWQKKDDNTWLKVVPPWWCEQRTVHFATKVYKELFCSAGSALLVDPQGGEWLCLVQTEARNDNRPQYTLRGAFADLWQAQGICSGDTLIFKRDLFTGRIDLTRHAVGSGAAVGAKMEEAANSELSEPCSAQPEASEGRGGGASGPFGSRAVRARQEDYSRGGPGQHTSHPNRWMELSDGWAVKTVYKSTLAHQQCPIAGWLFKKLYGRLPGDTDRAPMYDPDLHAEYRFDVAFVSAANVHYVTGRTFSAWMRESGLQAGEQIRMRRDPTGRVLIQRVPTDQARVDFVSKGASRVASFATMAELAPASGGNAMELPSPPTAEALDALDALVAAAGYAGTHGTPAIQAVLASAGDAAAAAAMAAAGLGGTAGGPLGFGLPSMAVSLPLPLPKRRRTSPADGAAAATELLLQHDQAVLSSRRAATGAAAAGVGSLLAAGGSSSSLAEWQPSSVHMQMFGEINAILGAHQWTAEEQKELTRFRGKFAWMDGCGREVAYLTISQLRADKAGLLEFARSAGQGILAQLPTGMAASTVTEMHPMPAAAAAVPVSPFAAAAAGAAPAAPPASNRSPTLAMLPEQQQQQQHSVQHPAGSVHSLELPTGEDPGTCLGFGLEGAASFNLPGGDVHPYFGGSGSAEVVKAEPGLGDTAGPAAGP